MRAVQAVAVTLCLAASPAFGQEQTAHGAWTLRSRILATGTNRSSDPAGYTTYSAFPIELAVSHRVRPHLGVEFAARTESREVDLENGGPAQPLGSVELLPCYLLLQYHPAERATVQPYVGLGVNLTVAWEKSGVLDSMDLSPSVGPAVQLGADVRLTSSLIFNVDVRSNTMRTNLESGNARVARLVLDPFSFGIGLGMRF